jgi:hypothetical protein
MRIDSVFLTLSWFNHGGDAHRHAIVWHIDQHHCISADRHRHTYLLHATQATA